jgi:branched-chain amino acid transport system ATP-binding protein
MTVLLDVRDLTMRFGGLVAVDSLSFQAEADKITAIIGPNGAGKTTVFNCLTGFYEPSEGAMRLRHPGGAEFKLERLAGYEIARHARVVRTFQNVRLFGGMSVLENLMVAQHVKLMRASTFSIAGLLNLPQHRRAQKDGIERALYWLDRVGLARCADDAAGSLPYGAQRRLEVARAMCAEPVLLCLDEPAAGLNPRESHELSDLILSIRQEHDVSVLLIEHDMSLVMRISDHIVVLDHGACIAAGPPAEIRGNAAVIRAYLGEDEFAYKGRR